MKTKMTCPECGASLKEKPIDLIIRYATNCASRERARAERCNEPLRSRAIRNAQNWEAGVQAIKELLNERTGRCSESTGRRRASV